MPSDLAKSKKTSSTSFFGMYKARSKGCDLQAAKNQFFGVDLSQLKDVVHGEPRPLKDCLDFLETRCESEGLFRLSASMRDIEMARANIDKGLPIKFSDQNGTGQEHIAAAIVKSFLRELPVPILEPATKIQVESLDELKSLVASLPPINASILKHLFHVLKKIDSLSEFSKMNASNLAVIIGPNLLWTLENSEVNSPAKATKIAFMLMQHYEQIFSDTMDQTTECIVNTQDAVLEHTALDEEANPSDLDIIIGAIYELQREIYALKVDMAEEVSKRLDLEKFIQQHLDISEIKSKVMDIVDPDLEVVEKDDLATNKSL